MEASGGIGARECVVGHRPKRALLISTGSGRRRPNPDWRSGFRREYVLLGFRASTNQIPVYRKRSFANAEKWWAIRQARSGLHIGEISVGLRGHAGIFNLWWIVESQKPYGPQAECV